MKTLRLVAVSLIRKVINEKLVLDYLAACVDQNHGKSQIHVQEITAGRLLDDDLKEDLFFLTLEAHYPEEEIPIKGDMQLVFISPTDETMTWDKQQGHIQSLFPVKVPDKDICMHIPRQSPDGHYELQGYSLTISDFGVKSFAHWFIGCDPKDPIVAAVPNEIHSPRVIH